MNKELTPITSAMQTADDPHAESRAIVARLMASGNRIDINLPSTLAEQQQWALARYDEHLNAGLQFGYALVVIKQQLDHGAFGVWLESNGIKDRTAQEYMKVAKFLSRMTDKSADSAYLGNAAESNSKTAESADLENTSMDIDSLADREVDAVLAKIIKLPLYKQLILAKESPERIREYMQSDLFDEIDKMPPSEIRAIIRQQKEIESLRAKGDSASHQLYLKHTELESLKKIPRQHLQMDVLRKQLLQDCELVQGAMQRMRKIFEEAKHFTQEFEEDARNLIAFPALLSLDAIQGNAYEISKNYRERWGINSYLPISAPPIDQLTEEELFLITEAVKNQRAATRQYEIEMDRAAKAEGKNRRGK